MVTDLKSQSCKTALWNNRPVVVLQEDDQGTYRFHGVMIGPAGMSVEQALLELDAAFVRAKFKGGDEWNYDEVLEEMRASGFEQIQAAEWWEPR